MPKARAPSCKRQEEKKTTGRSRRGRTKKDPKASHLYTDDNPATTIHGTGFKDAARARHTLELIKDRSLTYQFQTVNTMYNRAKHHPSMKEKRKTNADANAQTNNSATTDMQAAMDIFRRWLDETYPNARAAARADGFKPLLSKTCVSKYLSLIDADASIPSEAKAFANMYVALSKGKRLANVLVDDSKPRDADWERKRYDALDALVPEGWESSVDWRDADLWDGGGGGGGGERLSRVHLEMVAWAWSPVGEKRLS